MRNEIVIILCEPNLWAIHPPIPVVRMYPQKNDDRTSPWVVSDHFSSPLICKNAIENATRWSILKTEQKCKRHATKILLGKEMLHAPISIHTDLRRPFFFRATSR